MLPELRLLKRDTLKLQLGIVKKICLTKHISNLPSLAVTLQFTVLLLRRRGRHYSRIASELQQSNSPGHYLAGDKHHENDVLD